MKIRFPQRLVTFLIFVVSTTTLAQGRVTFAALDADSDGEVSLEEFTENFNPPPRPNGRTPQPDRVFGRWDANGDGVLTQEEFDNRPRPRQR